MIIVIFCIATMAVGAPLVAVLVVSVASRREDAYWTLGKPARSALEAAARRIVAFDADSIEWPRSKAHVQAQLRIRILMPEAIELEAIEAGPEAEPWNAA
jgi:hypothetical protein